MTSQKSSLAQAVCGLVLGVALGPACAKVDADIALSMGVRVGEVTSESAVLWTRVDNGQRNVDGPDAPPAKWNGDLGKLHGSVEGRAGRVVFTITGPGGAVFETAPVDVSDTGDYSAKVTATGLSPATQYRVTAVATDGAEESTAASADFVTAAAAEAPQSVRFAVITGQEYRDRDAGDDGFLAYDAMRTDKLNFLVYTGDSVYYDRRGFYANSIEKMRHFWHRMYSLPKAVEFAATTPAYYEVDDHDILDNDSWPTKKSRVLAPITMADGLSVLREQTPIGDRPYRSVRWGKDLEVWFLEGRLYRSPNPEPDGPDKTVWGDVQKAWLQQSLVASDATFKVVVSPTPIVGPDRSKGKNDNHANAGFATEGQWFKSLATSDEVGNLVVCCGDRHWQYHSIDPEFGLNEFSSGPLSDEHAGGAPKEQPDWQKFRRVKGGYLRVDVARVDGRPRLAAIFCGVDGREEYEWEMWAQ